MLLWTAELCHQCVGEPDGAENGGENESVFHDALMRLVSPAMTKGVELAESYNPKRYQDWSNDEKIADIKKYVCLTNAGIGAITAIPFVGFATALPAGILASLTSQVILASALAKVNGFDAREDLRAQILVMSLMAGDGATDVLSKFGVRASKKGLAHMIFAFAGMILFAGIVPFAGMIIGGLADGGMCLMVSSGMENAFVPYDAQ